MFSSRKVLVALGCACMLAQSHAAQQLLQFHDLMEGLKGQCSETKSNDDLKKLVDGLEWNDDQKANFVRTASYLLGKRHRKRGHECSFVKMEVQKQSLPESPALKRTTSAPGPKDSVPALARDTSAPGPKIETSNKPALKAVWDQVHKCFDDLKGQIETNPFLVSYVKRTFDAVVKLPLHRILKGDVHVPESIRRNVAKKMVLLRDHCRNAYYVAKVKRNWGAYNIVTDQDGAEPRFTLCKDDTVIIVKNDVHDNDAGVMTVEDKEGWQYPVSRNFEYYFQIQPKVKVLFPNSVRNKVAELARLLKLLIRLPELN